MNKKYWIVGKNPVIEAIKNPKRKIIKILAKKENQEILKKLLNNIKINTSINVVEKNEIEKITQINEINNQGYAVLAEPIQSANFKTLIKNNLNKSTIIILDNVTDQRNIGAITRISAAFNFDGIIIDKRIYDEANPIFAKAASGSNEFINIFTVSNINNAIRELKNNDYWITGLDVNSTNYPESKDWSDKKKAIVLGSEGKGLKSLVKKNCDDLVKIKINEKIESLNVSSSLAYLANYLL